MRIDTPAYDIVKTAVFEKQELRLTFDPCRIIPPCSWAVPGRNPGTSTNVSSGILKASQNRTNRAACVAERSQNGSDEKRM